MDLVLMKRKKIVHSYFQASLSLYNDSWEERAFMADAAGVLGGCIWPPRSYSCSFCNRDFRSAQALGGHMNVHRRDRARLKQSLSPSRVSPVSESDENPKVEKNDISVGLNFIVFNEKSEEIIRCKRPKIVGTLQCSNPRSLEVELDLELRLGGSPKVK